ncbi:VgrG-related protein [Enterobacter cloacae]|uniref:EF-hand domain-containing protein n=1 Tax=Enterobacter cloacae TaxID=550 RepID=A0A3R8YYI2_ENTCL|nr:hypothetical protein [Enterobacter cloacae]RSB23035.1 hypothetical protein EGK68_25510 [Enterobacter cloacae]
MKICFPARKANGKDYSTLDEMMAQVGREPHGTWLAGTNGMWHGGIHISRESAPASFLTSENVDSAVPLPFMSGGEVVAYRLNSQYLTDTWLGQTLQYSSTFVLVKSVCTPDPDKPDNSLEFYALYLGLTPPSAFPALQCYQVTAEGNGLRTRHYSGQEKTGEPAPVPTGKLATGQKVVVLRENLFGLDGHIPTFGLARLLNEHDEMTGEAFWVSLDPLYMTPEGKHTAPLPAWMQQAVTQGIYDTVVIPATRMTVAAGDAVGFLGEDIVPGGLNKAETDPYVHIEVLSTDDRLPDFLRNAAGVTGGEKYLHIRPESSLYTRSGDTFTKTSGNVRKDIHKILPQAKCPSFTDSAGKRWFDIGQGAWLSGDDVEADISQYDLIRRGFSAFEQPATASMEKSLHENWVKSVFNHLSEWVRPERGIREKQVSNYYQALISKIDQNHDGELSGEELHVALQYPEMDVRDLVAGLVIKHDSEWSGGSSHLRWTDYLKHMDLLLTGYVRTWLDNMEWMSQVPPFDKGKPVWHMHPVKFLDAIATKIKLWELGTTSEHYESGGRGPGVISSGRGDHGGASYGCYQLSSKLGVVQDYIKQSKYKNRFDGLQIGTQEFNSEWKNIAIEDKKGFSHDQYLFIKKTHYEAQLGFLAKHGISITHKRAAIHDMIWSTSVQYGPYTNLIVKAVAGLSFDSATDVQIITAVQDYKHDNVETKFRSSPTLWPGLKARAISEKAKLLKLERDNYEVE